MPDAACQTIRLLVVDDHAMFRDAIAEKLEKEPDMTVVGTCGSAAEGLALLAADPGIVLLDFDLGPERALDFLRDARQRGFEGRILIVTAGVSGREAVQLIQGGVQGIVHKHNTPAALCGVIRQVARGEVFLEKVYLGPVFHGLDQTGEPKAPRLTGRDKSILRLLFQGLANKEMAGRLEISEGAIKSAVSQLFHKLGVRSRAQLVKAALEQYGDEL